MADSSDPTRADERREQLAGAIKRYRERAGLTQAEFGALLGGLPQTTVSRWEHGLVSLDIEQVRSIDVALHLPLGTLGRAAGFVDPGLVGDEDAWPGFRVGFHGRFEDAQEELTAAATLGLGVRLFNRWRPGADDTRTEEWVVVLYEDAYELGDGAE